MLLPVDSDGYGRVPERPISTPEIGLIAGEVTASICPLTPVPYENE
jgi:hypothetical protein